MSTVQTIKTQIQELINLANRTTGNLDKTLTSGVNSLISKYDELSEQIANLMGEINEVSELVDEALELVGGAS